MGLAQARLYADFHGLADLKARSRGEALDEATLDEVARQFEALLGQMMVKSMRAASLGDGLLDNDQSLFYRDMYDQQLALHLSERGLGLRALIRRQLGATDEVAAEGRSVADYLARPLPVTARAAPAAIAAPTPPEPESERFDSPDAFIAALWPAAERAAARIGIDPRALLAQAALETGWGQGMIRHADGRPSHNLFGIKADARWHGPRAVVSTLEYEGGVAVRRREPFRSYASFEQSMQDYVAFLQSSPRYTDALRRAGDPQAYFRALAEAGYATDPDYAAKIDRIMDGSPMREALERLQNGPPGPTSSSRADG